MRVLYLFVVYRSPEMVHRIISRLDNGKNLFLIHVDSGSCDNFDQLQNNPHVIFTSKRYRTAWGAPDLVYAVVDALKESLHFSWDYVCLLSESDYPVKTAEYISSYLEKSNLDHILINKLPHDNPLETPGGHWLEGGRRRTECYALRLTSKQIATIEPQKFDYGNFRQIIKVLRYNTLKLLKAFEIIIKYPKRNKTIDVLCGGHQWFFLKRKTIDSIMEFINYHKDFYIDSRNTSCLDEIFFPTIVNAIVCPDHVSRDILRYISWSDNGQASPVDISLQEKNILNKCMDAPNILFIRKVSDCSVCDYIDNYINFVNSNL